MSIVSSHYPHNCAKHLPNFAFLLVGNEQSHHIKEILFVWDFSCMFHLQSKYCTSAYSLIMNIMIICQVII